MTATVDKPRRPRRIASDEAQAWARNLRLGNTHAKFVLYILAGYVNGEGVCFVGVDRLADDTELAPETVRRRLAWLEDIGAVARSPQWIDANGKRNGDGRGKRTSDDIKLLVDADVDDIEMLAAGEIPGDLAPNSDEFSPLPQTGLNPEEGSVSPLIAPSLQRGPNALNREPEEIPPDPPRGDLRQSLNEAGRKRFQEFKAGYPDGIVDLDAAEREYAGLTEADQIACNAAVLAYAARCQRRREKSMKAHLFVRKQAWKGLLASPEIVARPAQHSPGSPAGRALARLGRIARYTPLAFADGMISYREEITARLLAMAELPPETTADDPPVPIWKTYAVGTANFAAWRDFIREVFAGRALPQLTEIYVPWPWPPRKDGSLSTTGPPGLMTEEDLVDTEQGL